MCAKNDASTLSCDYGIVDTAGEENTHLMSLAVADVHCEWHPLDRWLVVWHGSLGLLCLATIAVIRLYYSVGLLILNLAIFSGILNVLVIRWCRVWIRLGKCVLLT